MNKHIAMGVCACISSLFLAACDDTGSIREPSLVSITAQSAADGHTEAHASKAEETHPSFVSFRRADGMRIDLQVGLVNVVPVELVPCLSVATLVRKFGDFVLGSAHAHAGETHGETFEIGYVDALQSAEPVLLGVLSPAAGEYCGVRLALENVAEMSKHGAEIDRTLHGVSANAAPCYFHHTAGLTEEEYAADDYDKGHSCIQTRIATSGVSWVLDFAEALSIAPDSTQWQIALQVHYQTWFDDVVMDDLESVVSEQEKLLENISASVHVEAVAALQ